MLAHALRGLELVEDFADYLRSANLDLPQAVLDPQLLLSRHYSAVGLPATLFLAADGTLAGSKLASVR